MKDAIRVGMAELKVARAPGKVISLGLGSCVGVCAYDSAEKVGGIAHVMLPSSAMAGEGAIPAKFADTAVPLLLEEMKQLGAVLNRITVKIVGGAQMFISSANNDSLNIGAKNIQAVEATCEKAGVPIVGRRVGGHNGINVTLDLDTGEVQVKTMNETYIV